MIYRAKNYLKLFYFCTLLKYDLPFLWTDYVDSSRRPLSTESRPKSRYPRRSSRRRLHHRHLRRIQRNRCSPARTDTWIFCYFRLAFSVAAVVVGSLASKKTAMI